MQKDVMYARKMHYDLVLKRLFQKDKSSNSPKTKIINSKEPCW